ncbi:MAG: molybdopterin-dependent oxidoreductase [Meiothermus sp.]|uniref:molybdopterin-dependent oxidoreductase n=1 Tax=Meiothermus sp. TaxID=1955249 RepID=UPI00263408FE|nr:molybdopterin-dependent oxidoreductase [Meiothermus sp.]MCS7058491.1 molybdopterin-dependent oxidoreductase [Meiothermus sp.]MCX7741011.1 molybdopterin-dependent oxidoreductase [Meiothermus sp.]
MDNPMHRRNFLQRAAGVLAAAGMLPWVKAQTSSQTAEALPSFTGPGPNPYWNGVNPFVVYPQKLPLLRLTDRGIQLETPRQYFRTAFTPNEAFFVRYHLDLIPNSIDLSSWRLNVEGNVEKPLTLSMQDLLTRFKPVSVAAVNQCSGNSRSRFQPRVAGGQWGNGAMGNALWTGVRLMDLLQEAGVKPGTVQLQFQGLDRGPGPEGKGSNAFIKSLDWNDPVLQECIVAYRMNGEPLPMLNGFPVRLVVPGKFSTYWMKHLTWIRALTKPDDNFWMATAYRIPDTPRGNTTPADIAAGKVKTVPIGNVNMPVRSFIVDPDGSSKLVAGLPVEIRGVAFSGYGRVTKVEVSLDGGKTWRVAQLGDYHGPYSFRTWSFQWKPTQPGRYTLAVRATDEKGNVQPDEPVWNPGGYLWNRIERQDVVVGTAS